MAGGSEATAIWMRDCVLLVSGADALPSIYSSYRRTNVIVGGQR